jgi:uncharacterized protein YcbK (DUF882 family)
MPVVVSSGFRSAQLCLKIRSSSLKSQHTAGQAADFEIFGISPIKSVAHYIDKNLDYDQIDIRVLES